MINSVKTPDFFEGQCIEATLFSFENFPIIEGAKLMSTVEFILSLDLGIYYTNVEKIKKVS